MKLLDAFTRAYLECALWTSDPADPGCGEWSVHDDWTLDAIYPTSLNQAIADCMDFQESYAVDLALAGDDAQNGHDFWLTRNGHGTGFWDRGYAEDVSRRLTDAAADYGEVSVLGPETTDQGDCTEAQWAAWDGMIYFS